MSKPHDCCNTPRNLKRTWHQDTLLRKALRLVRKEPLPHRLVDHCKVCHCNHYIMIVPEVPIDGTGFDIGTGA